METFDEEIIDKAVLKLTELAGLKTNWKYIPEGANNADGELAVYFHEIPYRFLIYCKKEIFPVNLKEIMTFQLEEIKPIVIALRIGKKIRGELRNNKIAYLDAAGNAFLKIPDHYIFIEGLTDLNFALPNKNRAFTKAGLKVIFYMLKNPGQINAPYRQIAEQTGVALDTINKTFKALNMLGFIIRKDKNTKKLWNLSQLMERWITAYDATLKPGLHIGNYRFLTNEDLVRWKEIDFKNQPTWWGGEPAADLLTNYLNPEIFTIYTEESGTDLIKKYRLIPDKAGPVMVYRTFGEIPENKEPTVHPLLIYTDLVNTGDSRNIKTAQIIYEKFLKDKF